jgi:hypothetical protein
MLSILSPHVGDFSRVSSLLPPGERSSSRDPVRVSCRLIDNRPIQASKTPKLPIVNCHSRPLIFRCQRPSTRSTFSTLRQAQGEQTSGRAKLRTKPPRVSHKTRQPFVQRDPICITLPNQSGRVCESSSTCTRNLRRGRLGSGTVCRVPEFRVQTADGSHTLRLHHLAKL